MNIKKTCVVRLAAIAFVAVQTLAQTPPAPDRVREYTYDPSGNITQIGSDTFAYDSVDRLVSGMVSGRERAYAYDAFGNRVLCADVASGSDCQYAAAIDSALNRVAGASYDSRGSLASYGGQTYQYDAAGMLTSRNGGAAEYVYTADDERIAVIIANHWQWSLRNNANQVLREVWSTAKMDGSHENWQWRRDNVFRSGTLLSSVDPSGTRHYHTDHLGTPRVVTDTTGRVIGVHDYYPFGLEVPGNVTEPDAGRLRFTGHERDSDGLDYMHARFYEPKWGRLLSVDPGQSVVASAPQTWNRYSYALNDPVGKSDPDGRYVVVPKNMRARVSGFYANSATYRRMYDSVHDDHRVLQKLTVVTPAAKRIPSSRAETTEDRNSRKVLVADGNVQRDSSGKVLTAFSLTTKIPPSNDLGPVSGHELQHGTEFLAYGSPANAPDARASAGGGVETQSALDVEAIIRKELEESDGKYKLTPEQEEEIFSVDPDCASDKAKCPPMEYIPSEPPPNGGQS